MLTNLNYEKSKMATTQCKMAATQKKLSVKHYISVTIHQNLIISHKKLASGLGLMPSILKFKNPRWPPNG